MPRRRSYICSSSFRAPFGKAGLSCFRATSSRIPSCLPTTGSRVFRTGACKQVAPVVLAVGINLFERPDPSVRGTGIVAIPPGYFLNWRSGLRRAVPTLVTKLRARHLLDQASGGRVVHYWLHPENVATAPATIGLLRMPPREVALRRDAGRCEVMTQLDYCRSMQQPNVLRA